MTTDAEILQTKTSSEWLARLDKEEVPSAPVLGRHEVLTHPQIEANELIELMDHPVAGPIRQARPAARFDKTPAGIQRHAPVLGADARFILRELDYGDEDISKLAADGVILEPK